MSTASELPHRSNTVPKDAGRVWGSLWECGEGVSNSTREESHEHALECLESLWEWRGGSQ